MHSTPKNTIEFRVWGRYAMFTDPLTRVGGEKYSYHLPTYEALKGIVKSIYWKPTFIWYVDCARVMKRIRTQTKGMKPLDYGGGNTLAIYTYLTGDPDTATREPRVEYQVRAHFEWNLHRPELERDRNDGKHFEIAKRSLEHGGRQDIFLGTRECQGYVAPCDFGSGKGEYDDLDELQYGLMFHSFDYPDETGEDRLVGNLWQPKLVNGVLTFPRPDNIPAKHKKDIREMTVKRFGLEENLQYVETEAQQYAAGVGGTV
ncbi:MAG: type I-C CRISPR-associated protein Cas5c [Terracidiphilus sp.]